MLDHERPLVWIAQTDELCEQAAETWTYVWRAIGPQVPMRLGRLWGGNEVPEEPGAFQLVIATIDKLHSVQGRASDEYDWLRDPSVVVIDEAHGSVTPSYTQVLDWMGRAARGRDKGARRPLIGLTATPFRGNSEAETERLVGRYDGNRLDRGAFRKEDPYEELQEMGVLAQVRHEILDGVDVHLTDDDRSEIQNLRRLPASVSERLGADVARTQRVVESIASLPDRLDRPGVCAVRRERTRAGCPARAPGRACGVDLGGHRGGRTPPLHRGVQGRAHPRPDQLQRPDPGIRRAAGPGRVRRVGRRSAPTCTSR